MTVRRWTTETAAAAETEALGALLGTLLPAGTTVWLHGDLGAGKTCLTRGLAQGLGVPTTEPVASPTYALMHLYRGRCPLYHFDLYRLQGAEQLDEVGFYEARAADGVVVVEWAERAGDPDGEGLRVELSTGSDEERRRCTVVALDPALDGVIVALAERWRSTGEAHEAL